MLVARPTKNMFGCMGSAYLTPAKPFAFGSKLDYPDYANAVIY